MITVTNIIPNSLSHETNQDSEPSIAVNPANPNQIAISAFTPDPLGGANAPVFISIDGGATWSTNSIVPGQFGETNDITIRFGRSSGNFYAAIIRDDPGTTVATKRFNILRTSNFTSSATMAILVERKNVDQPFIQADAAIGGPDAGQDRVYVGDNDFAAAGGQTATIDQSLDAGATTPAFTSIRLERRSTGTAGQDGPQIRPITHPDGTVYVIFYGWRAFNETTYSVAADIIVLRDDNWGAGAAPFTALVDPSDGLVGRCVANNVSFIWDGTLGQERLGGDLAIAVDPNNSSIVYIAFCDVQSGSYTIHIRSSQDRGVNWSSDLKTVSNAKNPVLAINSRGAVGLAYQQVVASGGIDRWETHFELTVNAFASSADSMLASVPANTPTRMGYPYLGDYMGMMAVGNDFFGVFSANNTPDLANFPNGVTYLRNHDFATKKLLDLDGVTQVTASIDPFFYKVSVPERNCVFLIERSTLGQDEIDARRSLPGGAVVKEAFRVIVDGFTAEELGFTGPDSLLDVPSPISGLNINCKGNKSETGGYGPEIQRFTFVYDLDFGADNTAFNFSGDTEDVPLNVNNVNILNFSTPGLIELIKQPNPFILHGDPYWLSIDLRVFVVREGDKIFGITMGKALDAPDFIQKVIKALNNGKGVADSQAFTDLSNDERLYMYPNDENKKLVFNFALAKVHYIGQQGAQNVRVFFRLFQAQSTFMAFDDSTTYRRAPSNPDSQPIPLAGYWGDDYVTIPCFALPRVDSKAVGMDQQTDSRIDSSGNVLGNVQTITAIADGSEVDTFFGCWLDINQPYKPNGDFNNVLPIKVATNKDGPFTDSLHPPLPIQQAILRNPHQCMVAEIAFDPIKIPPGKDPSNWDKLAQRNISWSDAPNPGVDASRRALDTFEIRPTPTGKPFRQTPDELMIDWGNTPIESIASIYLPAVNVDDILAMANKMYMTHRLARSDNHTLECRVGGITYIPIPYGDGINYAGLLSVDLPSTVKAGQVFNIVVRQVTSAFVEWRLPEGKEMLKGAAKEAAAIVQQNIRWRRVLGAFELKIPISTKDVLLKQEERLLSVLRWIQEPIPQENRWFLVFNRYVDQVAGRVQGLGGDPTSIGPSPSGEWQGAVSGRCRLWEVINAGVLAALVAVLGTISGVAALALAVLLVMTAYIWQTQCRPRLCSLMRVLLFGAGVGSLILVLLILVGVSSPHLVIVLAVALVLAVIAGVVWFTRHCF